ncbi:MAG TPA: lytic transglycosylase domain-containing protein [Streptosporangiaceae bacterium]|jgi:hypothetical protein
MPRRASAVVAVVAIALGTVAGNSPAAFAKTRPVTTTLTSVRIWLPSPGSAAAPAAKPAGTTAGAVPMNRVVLPDLFAVAKHEITAAQLAKLARLRTVRNVIAVDGGAVRINGRLVNVIGTNLAAFRSWTPPQTAARRGIWAALGGGGFVTSAATAKRLRLRTGTSYQVAAASNPDITFGGTAAFGVPGVDALVSAKTSKELGLVPALGVLISAPGASLATLTGQVRAVLGTQKSQFVSLRSASQPSQAGQLPVDGNVPSGRPASYLDLFRASAKMYCPGLSWTVLAAIGQIESGDGANNGPSSAGALGPMQFMPATWSFWGIDGFGDTGTPNIMNPYDAVPAAARYLCAYSPGSSAANLSAAIFGYNHASWYVAEVLALAHEYAQVYG